jgi:hypothetical protein
MSSNRLCCGIHRGAGCDTAHFGSRLPAETCTFVRAMKTDIDYAADNNADSVHLVIP